MIEKKLKQTRPSAAAREDSSSSRPISALLSQVLVAYTVQFDNEFELGMGEAGYAGARLSLVVWSNLMRFISDRGISVRELTAEALDEPTGIKFQLGCLERWGFVALDSGTRDKSGKATARSRSQGGLRDGWGSGRGIGAGWVVRLTEKGRKAKEIWPTLFGVIDERWRKRFGAEQIERLRASLLDIIGRIDVELPHAVTSVRGKTFPARATRSTAALPLPTLLAQTLLAFAIEFERESSATLALCANVLRVLGENPIRVADIPRLTGGSPEMTAIGWQLKPYVAVEPDPSASRGKVARPTARGAMAQRNYNMLVSEIAKRWESRYGNDAIRKLRESLLSLFRPGGDGRPLLSEGLIAPAGVVRAGDMAPALGRRDVGSAAKQRARDLVAQTESFVGDPAAALPHYPLWDMNRGFGP